MSLFHETSGLFNVVDLSTGFVHVASLRNPRWEGTTGNRLNFLSNDGVTEFSGNYEAFSLNGILLSDVEDAPFDPTLLDDSLYALWEADDTNSLTLDGSAVTTWTDSIGGLAPTQSTAENKPTYSATSFNSTPGITFDGGDYLEMLAPALPDGAEECEMWALVSQDSLVAVTTTRSVFGYGTNNAARLLQRAVVTGTNRAQTAIGTGAGNTSIPETTADFSGIHVVRVRITATASFVSVDGGAETEGAAVPATILTRLRIGANSNAGLGGQFVGVIKTLAITGPLSTGQGDAFTNYLKELGGIA